MRKDEVDYLLGRAGNVFLYAWIQSAIATPL